jgi:hypothetical protein
MGEAGAVRLLAAGVEDHAASLLGFSAARLGFTIDGWAAMPLESD